MWFEEEMITKAKDIVKESSISSLAKDHPGPTMKTGNQEERRGVDRHRLRSCGKDIRAGEAIAHYIEGRTMFERRPDEEDMEP